MKKGAFIGLSTIDIIYYLDHHPHSNEKMRAVNQLSFAGGPATNAAISFSHFGNNGLLISGLGEDVLNVIYNIDISQFEIDYVDLLETVASKPTVSSIYVNITNGERSVVSVNGLNKTLNTSAITEELLSSCSIMLVDGHYMDTCIYAAQLAKSIGIPVVYDGGSWKDGTDILLKYVDYAICSENFFPPQCNNDNEVLDYFQKFAIDYCAITKGALPIIISEKGKRSEISISKNNINVIDTLGAGDIFHGVFCHFLSDGLSFIDALSKASSYATFSCGFYGPREWMKFNLKSIDNDN